MIDELIKGDTILLECKTGEDISNWKIRAELWDGVSAGVDIKKATANSGGSDSQIEVTDVIGGVFIIKINKGETTDIQDQANIEIEVETNEGAVYTVFKSIVKFNDEKIKWSTP